MGDATDSYHLPVAVAITVVITIVLSLVRVQWESKVANARACMTWPFMFYLLLSLAGNIVALALSPKLVHASPLTHADPWSHPLLYSFVAIFGFSGIMAETQIAVRNFDLQIFHKGLMWSLDNAAEATLKKGAMLDLKSAARLAMDLQSLSEEELNLLIGTHYGDEAIKECDEQAKKWKVRPSLFKSYRLAHEKTEFAKALVRSKRSEALTK